MGNIFNKVPTLQTQHQIMKSKCIVLLDFNRINFFIFQANFKSIFFY